MNLSPAAFERFTRQVDSGGPCWAWKGPKRAKGYGGFLDDKLLVFAHRASYEFFVGPIPEGLQLDHLCRNHGCVRPDHLEPVTSKENTLRGIGPTARNAVKTHCNYGHPFDAENTRVRPGGWRVCIACRLRCNKEQWAAKVRDARKARP